MKTGKAILGIVAGVSVGALLGLLLAPEKGKDTRKNIEKTGKKYAESIRKHFDATLDDITERYNKIKEDVSEFAHHTKAKKDTGFENR